MKKIFSISGFVKAILLSLCFISLSCNTDEDVVNIFTERSWKLTFISEDDINIPYNIWNSKAERDEEMAYLKVKELYSIVFIGSLRGNVISGRIEGKLSNGEISGSWSANSNDYNFKANVEGDVQNKLDRELVYALNSAFSYEGSNNNNLYIKYRRGGKVFRISFVPLNK